MRIGAVLIAVVAGVVTAMGGCDSVKKAATTAVTTAKQVGKAAGEAAGEVVDSAKNKATKKAPADTDGAFAIKAGSEINTKKGHASFVPGVDGRRSLLQLRSYEPGDGSTYPSILIHAPVDAASVSQLASKTIDARVFIQDAKGVIWDNIDGAPVRIQISAASDTEVKAVFVSGQVSNTTTGEPTNVTGSVTALLPK